MESGLRFHADVLTDKAGSLGDTTHYAIALRAGVRESTISRLLGGRTVPSLATLVALADAYNCALDDLVLGRAEPARASSPGAAPAQAREAVSI
ncbi:helix-turn-helix domain-containing protein [Streptomyces kronopolitis]|uniref:helix-turn-helix domain-containing protein n=1 Tax=Streptomyces kronopolitis TaxID=1612435 RepID=UPI0034186B90